MVDDHAIDSLRTWFDIEYEELKNEWKSGKYGKLSDCPSFKATAAYREAMNILIKACYLSHYVNQYKFKSLKKMIDEELEIENFWIEKNAAFRRNQVTHDPLSEGVEIMNFSQKQVGKIVLDMVAAQNQIDVYRSQPNFEADEEYVGYREGLYDAFFEVLTMLGYSLGEINEMESKIRLG